MVKTSPATKPPRKIRSATKNADEILDHEAISSTTEIVQKKIQKANKPSTQSNKTRRGSSQPDSENNEPYRCSQHNSEIEFICKKCLKELCGHCILKHSEHISSITPISEVMEEFLERKESVLKSPEKMFSDLKQKKSESLYKLDKLSTKVNSLVDDFFSSMRSKINENFNQSSNLVSNLEEFKERAEEIFDLEDTSSIKPDLVKSYLTYAQKVNDNKPLTLELHINHDSLINELDSALYSNLQFENFDSTLPDIPKCLHWFEWGRKRLNLYNLIKNSTQVIELDIHFKIPSFSRSIITPKGHIYILGGEEPEFVSRKEVYVYDTVANDRKLHHKAQMLHRKFDFTLAHLNNCIYVICGKDSSSEVVDTCERYSIEENAWATVANVKKKRYAASAVGIANKIYLFGGRSDYNNAMVNEIEEYCSEKDEWNILNVTNFNLWNPVEVCACIQIKEDQILIFGGSDAQIKDSASSLIFNINDYSLQKISDLAKPQVFVNAPFLYKNHVYALGNEYYMKHRNLHRFSVEKQQWELIF